MPGNYKQRPELIKVIGKLNSISNSSSITNEVNLEIILQLTAIYCTKNSDEMKSLFEAYQHMTERIYGTVSTTTHRITREQFEKTAYAADKVWTPYIMGGSEKALPEIEKIKSEILPEVNPGPIRLFYRSVIDEARK